VTSAGESPPAAREAELAQHYAVCEAALREKDRDAWLATLFAPADRRRRLHALHAFALEIAEIPGKVTQPLLGEMRLRWWQDALAAPNEDGGRAHPVLDALLDTLDACSLPRREVAAFLDAHVADLYDDPMPTTTALLDYCERTAAQPLRWSARALGAAGDAEALTEAGTALGLLGVLRRLPKGGAQFLPDDLLARHGARREDAAAGAETPQLRAAIAALIDRASQSFEQAKKAARGANEATRIALLPAATVPLYLQAMRARDFHPFGSPRDPAPWRRQWRLWRAARAGL
jgi:15-cis-phytoene synthase